MSEPEGPNPEVTERPQRRHFSTEYKLRILTEADRASKPGEIGALLRREGLYSSRLAEWRRQRERGALNPSARSHERTLRQTQAAEIRRLRRENERLNARLATAEKVIEIQGKVSTLLQELSRKSSETPPDT